MLKVPHIRQLRDWSCGPACVSMVLRYHGITESEVSLIEALGSTESDGTSPNAIADYFDSAGYDVHYASSLRSLRRMTEIGCPVIVAYQDWAHKPSRTDYATSWDNGHYAVVVAADSDSVTLCDPSSRRHRRRIPSADFVKRWRDITNEGRIYRQWGCAVGPKR